MSKAEKLYWLGLLVNMGGQSEDDWSCMRFKIYDDKELKEWQLEEFKDGVIYLKSLGTQYKENIIENVHVINKN